MSLSIPAFHVSDQSQVKGRGEVFIASRKDAASSGTFKIEVSVAGLNCADTSILKVPLETMSLRLAMKTSPLPLT